MEHKFATPCTTQMQLQVSVVARAELKLRCRQAHASRDDLGQCEGLLQQALTSLQGAVSLKGDHPVTVVQPGCSCILSAISQSCISSPCLTAHALPPLTSHLNCNAIQALGQ